MRAIGGARGWAGETGSVLGAVLRNPSLLRVLIAYLLYVSVLWGTWISILLWAEDVLGAGQMGLAAAVQLLPAAVFAAVAATLADRYPRRRILSLGYLAQGLAFGAAGSGMLLGWPPAVVLAVLCVAAAATTLTRPTQGALLPDLARTPAEAVAANALAGTVEGVGVLAGPLAAAAILLVRPAGDVLLAGSAAALLAASLVVRLAPPRIAPTAVEPAASSERAPAEQGSHPGDAVAAQQAEESGGHRPAARQGPVARMLGGLRALGGSAPVALVVGILGLRMLLSGMLDILIVLLALDVFGLGGSGAGALQASFGLGTVLGGAASVALVGRKRLAPAIAVSTCILGTPLVALGAADATLLVPVLLGAAGVGFALVDVTGRTILQRVADPGRLATVLGSLEGVGLVALSSGALLAPALAGTIGVQGTVIATGLLLPLMVALMWVGLRRIDRRTVVPVREIALLRANRLFAPLAAPQLESVASRTRWRTGTRGSVIIREGDQGDRYYVLAEGSFRVTQGGKLLRDLDRPGDGVGEIALIRGVPRTATVTLGAPSVLLTLDREDFLEVIIGSGQARAAELEIAGVLAQTDDAGPLSAASDPDPA